MNQVTPIEQIQTAKELERCPFPIPFGWYMVEESAKLAIGEVRTIKAFDQEWVLFRGEDGVAGMTDPYCPHLGAHLGHGGVVLGSTIRCPFHHWEFDAQGWCKKIPYAKVMPGLARRRPVLRALPVEERYGAIFVWYHPDAAEPTFELPTIPELEEEGYIAPRRGMWMIGTAIQEIGENGVDFAHLQYLHGSPVMPGGSGEPDGYRFKTEIGPGIISGVHYGPGIQAMRFYKNDVTMLMFSTPLPVDRENTCTRMAFTFKDYPADAPERETAEHLYVHSIGAAEGEESAGFESVDLPIWDNKKYRPQPLLCDGDGPILLWREWFSQFYA